MNAKTTTPSRRLVIVVRADPVICGHSGEARCIAEVALTRGFDDVRILTWPLDRLVAAGLPLKPLDHVLPYSDGITVERPEPVGDYRVPDGRWVAGLTGRLVEICCDGVPTVVVSLYLSPHTAVVEDAVRVARRLGPARITTIAAAVGSDVTNIVRACVASGRFGAAAHLLSTYLESDHCVAVSHYTKDVIVAEAAKLDVLLDASSAGPSLGSSVGPSLGSFAGACAERIGISYPAVDSSAYLSLTPERVDLDLARRGLVRGGYVLFLSRLASAKGLDDLIAAYAGSRASQHVRLVLAGRGPQEQQVRDWMRDSGLADRVLLLTDVDDAEKPSLMAGSAAFVLPTRAQPEFVETFGIALVESMLAGGGPVITCPTGGVPEAVGDTAIMVPPNEPGAIRLALDTVVCDWTPQQRAEHRRLARAYAMRFDRVAVVDALLARTRPMLERAARVA